MIPKTADDALLTLKTKALTGWVNAKYVEVTE